MARITLIRHGKAEMPKVGVNDFDRVLVKRGIKNSEDIGNFLLMHKMMPDLFLVSTAARTRQTFEFMSSNWPVSPSVQFDDKLYGVSADTLLRLIFDYGQDIERLAVVGHNPSLVVLLMHLVGLVDGELNLTHFPTCCVADIAFDAKKIGEIDPEQGRLVSLVRVKDLTPLA